MNIHLSNVEKTLLSSTAVCWLFFIVCIVFSQGVMAISVGCDDAFVQLADGESVINVTATGSEDTDNIQCALDAAIDMGIPVVRLAADTFYISAISANKFNGTFEGVSKTATTIEVRLRSIDCVAMENSGYTPAAIKFAEGEPRIRFMTINANLACMTGRLSSILHFTSQSAVSETCRNDVIFGAVDRVILDGTTRENGPFTGILVAPEGYELGGCRTILLGTFKLNRSAVRNLRQGIFTNMKSGAQVDINFNEFTNNFVGVYLVDTNQNTTIYRNTFLGASATNKTYRGVSIFTDEADAPSRTRVVIDNNEFNVSSPFGQWSIAISGEQDGQIADISSIITNNQFILDGDDAVAVYAEEISNTHVSANRFTGSGMSAVLVSGNTPVTAWTITANKGLGTFSSSRQDLILEDNTSQCIIGPGQDATVKDDGTDNSNL